MGGAASRESEVSGRIIESLESGHLHTLQLLFKFVQHVPGGAPLQQLASKSGLTSAGGAAAPPKPLPLFRPHRPAPVPTALPIDENTAAFHARAAALARSQAEASGLASASFPIPLDLNALRMRSGDTLLVAAVKKDQTHAVRMLLEAGVEPDEADAMTGLTPLHHAAQLGRAACAQLLLDAHACALLRNNTGLLASQVCTNAELKRMIEEAEVVQDATCVREVIAFAGGSYVGRCAVFEESSSDAFPLVLYRMECAREVACSNNSCEVEVFFRGPAKRSAHDCICLFIVDDAKANPHLIRPRMGSVFYLAERRSQQACVPPSQRGRHKAATHAQESKEHIGASPQSNPAELESLGWDSLVIKMALGNLPMDKAYRWCYFDATRQVYLAATDLFTLRLQAALPPVARKASSAVFAAESKEESIPATAARQRSLSSVNGHVPSPLLTATPTASTPSSIFSFLTPWASSPVPAAAAPGTGAPVALHSSFAQLSDPSPANVARFSLPPPPYFRSHFALNIAAVQLALQLDPRLTSFRDSFVPAKMKEQEFWTRYFCIMSRLEDDSLDATNDRYGAPSPSAARAATAATTVHASQQAVSPSSVVGPSSAHPSSPASAAQLAAAAAAAAAAFSAPVSSLPQASPHFLTAKAVTPADAAPSPAHTPSTGPPAIKAAAEVPAAAMAAPDDAAASRPRSESAFAFIDAATTAGSAPPAAAAAPADARPRSESAVVKAMTSSSVPAVGRTPNDDEDDDGSSSYVPPSFAKLPAAAATAQ